MGLESTIENIVFGDGVRCLAEIKNSSRFMFAKLYYRPFKSIQKMTVYQLHNIYQRFLKGNLKDYNNLNLFMDVTTKVSTI